MASKKSKPSQADMRQFRSQWAKLRAKGLVKNDARSQKMTKHAKRQLKRYSDVLAGNADVITVPRAKAKDYSEFERTRNKIVVPKNTAGIRSQRTYYSKARGEIVRVSDVSGTKVTALVKAGLTRDQLRSYEGKGVTFAIYVRRGSGYVLHRRRFVEDLAEMFDDGSYKNFADWAGHVLVERAG